MTASQEVGIAAMDGLFAISSWMTGHPKRTLGGFFPLPDRNAALQLINHPAASLERRATMFGSDNDQHNLFSGLNPGNAMDDPSLDDIEAFQGFFPQITQGMFSHCTILVELDCPHVPAVGKIARATKKHRNPSDPA